MSKLAYLPGLVPSDVIVLAAEHVRAGGPDDEDREHKADREQGLGDDAILARTRFVCLLFVCCVVEAGAGNLNRQLVGPGKDQPRVVMQGPADPGPPTRRRR